MTKSIVGPGEKQSPVAASSRAGIIVGGLRLLNRRERVGAVGIVALMMAAGFLESAVVALVVPLVYVVVDPTRFNATGIGRALGEFVGRPIDQMFLFLAGGLAALLLVSAVASALAGSLSEVHSAHCRNRLSRELLGRIIAAPYLWTVKRSSVAWSRHVHEDVKIWRRDFLQSILMIVQAMIMIVCPAAVVILLAPMAGLATLAVVGVVCGAVVFAFRRKIRTVAARSLVASDAMAKSLLQILAGIREVKVSGHADYFAARFDRNHRAVNHLSALARTWGNAPAAIINLLGQLGFIATATVLWSKGSSGTEIAAQIALIAVVVSRVVPAFNRLAVHVATLFRGAPAVESLLGVIAEIDRALAEAGRATRGRPVPADWKRIVLDNVWFRYPEAEKWSVYETTIELERGKSYGFVGRSGAGKTTLVNLLLGLFEPERGRICIDGHPFTELALSDWHRRFGYVPQDSFLLDGTLRENILFGATTVDEARFQIAIHAAQLAEFVEGTPLAFDTPIGERGRRLSGGQAQRVAIARAFYRGPEILFLDEATSALDSVTEMKIQDGLDQLGGKMLRLIVAHRVTTLRRCDCIFVLEGGRIIESGTFDDLIQRSDLFRGLAAQATAAEVA